MQESVKVNGVDIVLRMSILPIANVLLFMARQTMPPRHLVKGLSVDNVKGHVSVASVIFVIDVYKFIQKSANQAKYPMYNIIYPTLYHII